MSRNRASSRHPKGDATTIGGVAIPLTYTMTQSTSQSSAAEMNQGQASTPASASSSSTQQLNGDASQFHPNQYLMHNSIRDGPVIVSSTGERTSTAASGLKITPAPIGTRSQDMTVAKPAVFTTDTGPGVPGGHYLRTKVKDAREVPHWMAELERNFGWKAKATGQAVAPSESNAQDLGLYLRFDDVRDAAQAVNDMYTINNGWELKYISQQEFANAIVRAETGIKYTSSAFDGQVHFIAEYHGKPEDAHADEIQDVVDALAKSLGEVLAFVKEDGHDQPGKATFRVEYYKISDAEEAVKQISDMEPHAQDDWYVIVQKMPSTAAASQQEYIVHSNTTPQKLANGTYSSPTGRSAWKQGEDGQTYAVAPPRTLPKVQHFGRDANDRVTNWRDRMHSESAVPDAAHFGALDSQTRAQSLPTIFTDYGSFAPAVPRPHGEATENEPQFIKVDRIMAGMDCRTTIMLRNLPNAWTKEEFLEILNAVCPGKFDFTYLRIDFQKCANVGYGFVNFTTADCIVAFYNKYIGKEWSTGLYPKKIAQMSYATIQGVDCLIEKFRNSAIMDEYPEFRPNLWYVASPETAGRPDLIGTEKPFPVSNNVTKKQRSEDNARNIGLYAPHSGPRNRVGRRSNYDRGTMHQIQEEAMLNHPSSPSSAYHEGNYTFMPRGPMSAPPQFQQPLYHPGMAAYPHAPYFNGAPGYAGWQYPGPQADPFFGQYGGPALPPPPPHHYAAPYPYYQPQQMMHAGNNVPPSRLRTISRGRLGGRPQNVTVAANCYTNAGNLAEAGPSHIGHVPRSFVNRQFASNGYDAVSPGTQDHSDAAALGYEMVAAATPSYADGYADGAAEAEQQ